jgi:RND family efflux transporter MFP subunit
MGGWNSVGEIRTSRRRPAFWLGLVLVVVVLMAIAWLVFLRPRTQEVTWVSVTKHTMSNDIFTAGTVRPVQRQVIYASEISGPVQSVLVHVGEHVRAGDELIALNASGEVAALQSAEAEVANAKAGLANANAQYAAAPPALQAQFLPQVLAAKNTLAGAEAQLASAKSALSSSTIRATQSGQVLQVNPEGIGPNGSTAPLVEVASPEKQVVLFVSQVDAVELKPGVQATLTSDAFQGKKWTGTVSSVAPYAAPSDTGAVEVEVIVRPKAKNFPVPYGYTVKVHLTAEVHKGVLTLPYSALVQDGSNYAVFTYVNGRAEERVVTLGLTDNSRVEVLSGVTLGTAVVDNPPANLVSGELVSAP